MLKRYMFLAIFAVSLFLFSYTYYPIRAQSPSDPYNSSTWFVFTLQNETDYDDDEISDVITTITPMNDTFLEIYVNQTTGKGGYKWSSAICNITGVQGVGKWEYNPATDWWSYTGLLNYDKLTYYGMNANWCNETDNYGFVLFGAGSGDKTYRLNFTEGHKVIQIHTGEGSEVKEGWTTGGYIQAKGIYGELFEWAEGKINDAYVNGTLFYAFDMNQTVEVKTSGIIELEYEISYRSENASKLLYFLIIGQRFICMEYPKVDTFETLSCPGNSTKTYDMLRGFAEKEVALPERAENITYSITYLMVDNKIGNLTDYDIETFPSEDDLFKASKKNPFGVFNLTGYVNKKTFSISFSYEGESHCMKFPVSTYANITLNITIPSAIVNHTLLDDYPQFILEKSIANNTLLAKIDAFPNYGIENMTDQRAEVCW